MRERIRKPLTGRALKITLNTLDKLAGANDSLKIAILEQSIQRSWQGIFPLQQPFAPAASRQPRSFAQQEQDRFEQEMREAQERDRNRSPLAATAINQAPLPETPKQAGYPHD